MKRFLFNKTVVAGIFSIVIKRFFKRHWGVGDDADRPEEISRCGVEHEGVQEVDIAHLSMGLMKRFVSRYLGVCN